MELHLPPIIVISVAAAAAILEDVDDEAPPPSRHSKLKYGKGGKAKQRTNPEPRELTPTCSLNIV